MDVDLVQEQLDAFDVLSSIFSLEPDSFTPEAASSVLSERLRECLDSQRAPGESELRSAALRADVCLAVDVPQGQLAVSGGDAKLSVAVALSLIRRGGGGGSSGAPLTDGHATAPYELSLRQPEWLSRKHHDALCARAAKECAAGSPTVYDVTEALSRVRELAQECAQAQEQARRDESQSSGATDGVAGGVNGESVAAQDEELARTWFWLPSLSTRSKRDDLVSYARQAGLTGFVLAGKPAIVCVEGSRHTAQTYMSEVSASRSLEHGGKDADTRGNADQERVMARHPIAPEEGHGATCRGSTRHTGLQRHERAWHGRRGARRRTRQPWRDARRARLAL